MTLKDHFDLFFNQRPSINKSAFARECGISKGMLHFIFKGERKLTEDMFKKLLPKMVVYGFDIRGIADKIESPYPCKPDQYELTEGFDKLDLIQHVKSNWELMLEDLDKMAENEKQV